MNIPDTAVLVSDNSVTARKGADPKETGCSLNIGDNNTARLGEDPPIAGVGKHA